MYLLMLLFLHIFIKGIWMEFYMILTLNVNNMQLSLTGEKKPYAIDLQHLLHIQAQAYTRCMKHIPFKLTLTTVLF